MTSTAAPAFTLTNPSGDGKTWVVTVVAGGLLDDGTGNFLDGVYQFTVHPTLITNGSGTPMVGVDESQSFRKLFGDVNRDGRVNNTDYIQLSNALGSKVRDPNYSGVFDYNHDGRINNIDYLQFNNRFGKALSLPG